MARWINAPDWSDATARMLHDALAEAAYHSTELEQIWTAIGMDPASIAWGAPARVLWPAMTKDAHAASKLEALIVEVKQRRAAVADRLDAILAAEVVTSNWYFSTDQFMSRLVGPGSSRALLNRSSLSSGLREIAREGFPVFAIRGEPGSGKSHSRYLIQHVTNDPSLKCRMILLDVAEEWPGGVDAKEFVRVLAQKVGIFTAFEVDENTEATRISRELANAFVARLGDRPEIIRWIFIDGLDRPGVHADVHAVVGHLAKEAESGQLGRTHLIVTGHPGDFAPSVLDVLVEEEIDEISRPHIELFFKEVAAHIDSPLTLQERTELVDRVLERAPLDDLRGLGRAASQVAREWFGAP
jgi:hypothetical protein